MLPGPPPPNPTPPSAGKFRLWMVAGLVVIVAGFAASTQIDTLQAEDTAATADDDQKTTTSDDDGTTGTSDTSEDEEQDGTTTTSTSSSSGGEGLDPLPGDDWGPAARDQFVADCLAEPLMSAGIALGASPEETCECLYERVADSGMSLDEFNEGWTDPNFEARPYDDPVKQLFLDGIASCTLS